MHTISNRFLLFALFIGLMAPTTKAHAGFVTKAATKLVLVGGVAFTAVCIKYPEEVRKVLDDLKNNPDMQKLIRKVRGDIDTGYKKTKEVVGEAIQQGTTLGVEAGREGAERIEKGLAAAAADESSRSTTQAALGKKTGSR